MIFHMTESPANLSWQWTVLLLWLLSKIVNTKCSSSFCQKREHLTPRQVCEDTTKKPRCIWHILQWKFFLIWKHWKNYLAVEKEKGLFLMNQCRVFFKAHTFILKAHTLSSPLRCLSQVYLIKKDALYIYEKQNCIHWYFMLSNINLCLYTQHKNI